MASVAAYRPTRRTRPSEAAVIRQRSLEVARRRGRVRCVAVCRRGLTAFTSRGQVVVKGPSQRGKGLCVGLKATCSRVLIISLAVTLTITSPFGLHGHSASIRGLLATKRRGLRERLRRYSGIIKSRGLSLEGGAEVTTTTDGHGTVTIYRRPKASGSYWSTVFSLFVVHSANCRSAIGATAIVPTVAAGDLRVMGRPFRSLDTVMGLRSPLVWSETTGARCGHR